MYNISILLNILMKHLRKIDFSDQTNVTIGIQILVRLCAIYVCVRWIKWHGFISDK